MVIEVFASVQLGYNGRKSGLAPGAEPFDVSNSQAECTHSIHCDFLREHTGRKGCFCDMGRAGREW